MRIAVTDANIFIDVIYIEIHLLLPKIGLEIYTTQNVLDELDEDQIQLLKELIQNNLIVIYAFSKEEQDEFSNYFIKRGLSLADHSVIFLAEKIDATVLSGDSLVRTTCHERKLEVHGVLWLLDECIDKKHLSHHQAHEKLTVLMNYNKRLPVKECEARIHKWKESLSISPG